MAKTKLPEKRFKSRNVTFPPDLDLALVQVAESEYLPVSTMLQRLVREALEARKTRDQGAVKRTIRPHSKTAGASWATAPPDVAGTST